MDTNTHYINRRFHGLLGFLKNLFFATEPRVLTITRWVILFNLFLLYSESFRFRTNLFNPKKAIEIPEMPFNTDISFIET